MLLELRDRLRATGPATAGELAHRLGLPVPLVEDMLQRWIAKGRVRRRADLDRCGRCGKRGTCGVVADECGDRYAWVEDQATPSRH